MSNELIKRLLITNPGFADSKLLEDFMVRSTKRRPGIPRNSLHNIKLSS